MIARPEWIHPTPRPGALRRLSAALRALLVRPDPAGRSALQLARLRELEGDGLPRTPRYHRHD